MVYEGNFPLLSPMFLWSVTVWSCRMLNGFPIALLGFGELLPLEVKVSEIVQQIRVVGSFIDSRLVFLPSIWCVAQSIVEHGQAMGNSRPLGLMGAGAFVLGDCISKSAFFLQLSGR